MLSRHITAAVIVLAFLAVALGIYFSPGQSCIRNLEARGVAAEKATTSCSPSPIHVPREWTISHFR